MTTPRFTFAAATRTDAKRVAASRDRGRAATRESRQAQLQDERGDYVALELESDLAATLMEVEMMPTHNERVAALRSLKKLRRADPLVQCERCEQMTIQSARICLDCSDKLAAQEQTHNATRVERAIKRGDWMRS